MNNHNSKFAISIGEFKISKDIVVEPDDVGIINEVGPKSTKVFFVRVWHNVDVPNNKLVHFDVEKTGDAYSKKICNVCHKLMDTSEFDRNQNGVNNRPVRRPSCKKCRRILDGMSIRHKIRKEWLDKKPVNEPFECPICGKRTIAGVTSKVVLDHNHITGEPRAWICDSCNTGIGRFKDDVALLQRAIEFLE